MVKKLVTQNQFNFGELSPRLYARSDLTQYENALETLLNAQPTIHGPVNRRGGFEVIGSARVSPTVSKLLKFQFDKDDGVIIAASNLAFTFFTSTGPVTEAAKTITAITKANPGVITSVAHGFSNGDRVYIESVAGMVEINSPNEVYIVAGVTADTFTLTNLDGTAINTTSYTTYTTGGTAARVYTLVTTYVTADIPSLSYTQFGDIIYIAHPSYPPRTLTRTSNTSWAITDLLALPEPSYEAGEKPATTCTPAATTGVDQNFTAGSGLFLAADVGRQIQNVTAGETGRASITSLSSSSVAVCDIVENFTNTNAIVSQSWVLDLSPVCDIEFDSVAAGSMTNVRSRYSDGYLDTAKTITGVTQASPGVVTTGTHGYVTGDIVTITDVVGMTELNNVSYRILVLSGTTFSLQGINTTSYAAYSSGGKVRKQRETELIPAFRAGDVGRYIIANGGVLKIITVNSSSDVDCEILKSMTTSARTGLWTLESAAWTAGRGYPRSVGVHEQRLVFGSTTTQPQTVWMSEAGLFDAFGVGTEDGDAIQVDLSSGQVNQINWFASAGDLVIGTAGGEQTIGTGATSGALTPTNIKQRSRSYFGSDVQIPVVLGSEVMFVQQSGRKIQSYHYDYNIDNYDGEDLTFFSEHITIPIIDTIVSAKEPDSLLIGVLNDGTMIVGTYSRTQKVIGWARYETDGDVESVQTISAGDKDEIWVIVKRTINSLTRRTVERLSIEDGVTDTDSFSDCSVTFSTPIAITDITRATTPVFTTATHGLTTGDTIIVKGLVDPRATELDADLTNMSDINQSTFTVTVLTSTTFSVANLDTSSTLYNPYGSSGYIYKKETVFRGLHNLAGETVQARVDGAVTDDVVVTAGGVATLTDAGGQVVFGLPYTTTIKTLRKEFDIGLGSMQAQKARYVTPVIRIYNSSYPTVNGVTRPSRSAAFKQDQKVPLYSGDVYYSPSSWSDEGQLTISSSSALPLQIQGIFGTIEGGVK